MQPVSHLSSQLQSLPQARGNPSLRIGLIDGPVDTTHAALQDKPVLHIGGHALGPGAIPARHATFIATQLFALCPACTLVSRPIFDRTSSPDPHMLADAIVDCLDGGARVVNLSLAVRFATDVHRGLRDALDHAARSGVLVVAAAGNEGSVGSSAVTQHPWVIPVAACDAEGRVTRESNLGRTIGSRGLLAPADARVGDAFRGTSVAAAHVTGVAALLWSLFPTAPASAVHAALRPDASAPRMVPPRLDASMSYKTLSAQFPEAPHA